MRLFLELYLDGLWKRAAEIEPIEDHGLGLMGKVSLEYDIDFASDHQGAWGHQAISCRYPVSFAHWVEAPWPAFLLDLLPAGAARQTLLARHGWRNSPAADWKLLALAQHAPGNLRIAPAADEVAHSAHPGFSRSEVIARGPDFIEYAFDRGAPVAGSSGAQGEAPKFLLCEDKGGRWHAEGAIPLSDVQTHWLVKFPRGRHSSDELVLREEARYMDLAGRAGLRVQAGLDWEQDCLFVPRFDRWHGVLCGQESLASLSGHTTYGASQTHQRSAKVLAQFVSEPEVEILEFLRRDVLNLLVGNSDNHLRNSTVLKYPDGRIELSPVFDLAPMILDRSGIPRRCRWDAREPAGGPIDWEGVVGDLSGDTGISRDAAIEVIAELADVARDIPDWMKEIGVHGALREQLKPRQTAIEASLREVIS